MTESEWLASNDPSAMLQHLRSNVSDRKLRLFACACCRRTWHLLADERSKAAVEAAERYADKLITADEMVAAGNAAWAAVWAAAGAAARVAAGNAAWAAAWDAAWAAARAAAGAAAWKEQAALLRDIFGNPWKPVDLKCSRCEGDGKAHGSDRPFEWSPDPDSMKCPVCEGDGKSADLRSWLAWNGGLTLRLAQSMYEAKRFNDLPVLADALEEAGCSEASILEHARSGELHVRGCWLIDLMLGQE